MANKALATRQKMTIRVEPSQQFGKPRNPVAVAAKQRPGGPHVKSPTAQRQAEKRALAKAKLVADD
ncbi:hypothetical protein Q4S45_21715 [Massilia sp. R2A-15]|uniref:hypothetical protein n=1 Tax=Massilia sp. R2A-15 TaxID=3064278 RepID=UPI0027339D6D|nr:hypothetical protein [Massilia sp. R2A-15]WLI89280.1 hypothetical protein Q4S45_21715 [Massilia sp. R2A-15]